MRDGRQIVVKVQRPDIRETVVKDLEIMQGLAEFLDSHTETGRRYDFAQILAELRKSLMRELDYRQEMRHLIIFNRIFREFGRIVVPLPVEDYCTSRVLTMEYIKGKKITS